MTHSGMLTRTVCLEKETKFDRIWPIPDLQKTPSGFFCKLPQSTEKQFPNASCEIVENILLSRFRILFVILKMGIPGVEPGTP
ncbi:MAG TPA: hypothetical protein PK357_02130 [Candidatus Pacearchaeota archaeon]|nr:hypothetical protein [Candidatus Pacearchaeota archaeon]